MSFNVLLTPFDSKIRMEVIRRLATPELVPLRIVEELIEEVADFHKHPEVHLFPERLYKEYELFHPLDGMILGSDDEVQFLDSLLGKSKTAVSWRQVRAALRCKFQSGYEMLCSFEDTIQMPWREGRVMIVQNDYEPDPYHVNMMKQFQPEVRVHEMAVKHSSRSPKGLRPFFLR